MEIPLVLNLDRMLPEFLVAGAGLAAILPELVMPAGKRAVATAWTSAIGLAAALACLLFWCPEGIAMLARADGESGAMITGWMSDKFSIYCRAILAGGGLLLVLLSMPYTKRMDKGHGEFYAILLFAILGSMLVTGVSDLLSLFVCLELVTIMAYVLAAFRRNHLPSTEAGLKYLVVGAVSTAVLLLGIALIYGGTGSLALGDIATTIQSGNSNVLLVMGIGLVLIGMLFKIGGVPFHVWIPDVYEGSPTPTTAFLSTASKSAGVVLLLRFAYVALIPAMDGVHSLSWVLLLSSIAIITLFFGSLGRSFAAIHQATSRLLVHIPCGLSAYGDRGDCGGRPGQWGRVRGALLSSGLHRDEPHRLCSDCARIGSLALGAWREHVSRAVEALALFGACPRACVSVARRCSPHGRVLRQVLDSQGSRF